MLKLAPNVTVLPVITTLDVEAERVLKAALESELKTCIIIGERADGELYFAATVADGGDVLWWIEKAKLALMGVT